VHFLQIWILPDRTGLPPGYEQRSFDLEQKNGTWVLVAAPDARGGALKVHQNAELSLASLAAGQDLSLSLKPGRRAWLQIARGRVTLNGSALEAGDGAAVSEEGTLALKAIDDAETLLFDLA
jgi:quercetin 2,3-dioxygenase